jgi:3-deoxy-7-phosphoheptulonate synthase / chorismate mutase
MDQADDPAVTEFRSQITATDERLVALVNARIELVAGLHAHKRDRGYTTFDPDRERLLLEHLGEVSDGPLSNEGLRKLYATVIELCTSEARRVNNDSREA